jgi:hypothetical protein
MTILAVQEVVVTWTKQARGGQEAARRNAIPEAFPLLSIPQINEPLALLHDKVTSFEDTHHTQTVDELIPRKRIYFGCVSTHLEEDKIVAIFAYNMSCGGAPVRTDFPRKVLSLPLGSWGRIRYNGRFSSSNGQWYYRKTVLNIGHFDTLTEAIFMTKPQREFSDMADLW